MPIRLKYYILLFLPFFMLFYAEGIKIGSLTVSQLWKLPLIVYFTYYLFQYRKKQTPAWAQGYYWIATKHLVNAGTIKNIFANIQDGISFLFLPLIYNYFHNSRSREVVERILLCISQYFVLTNIPFLFFGLKSHAEGLQYGEMVAYTGIFQNQHAMSTIMGICIIVILYYFKKEFFSSWQSKLFNVCLLALAMYAMYLGFARTGWLMCLLGVVILFMPRNTSIKQWLGILSVGVVLSCGFTYLMLTNKTFHDRILDINTTTGKQKDLGSGRGEYIANAIELYLSGNIFELAFGKSMDDLKDYEYQKTGMRIYAHNGFATLLATNGAIGVLLKLMSMTLLYCFIRRRKDCVTHNAAMAFWCMNLSYQLTQGGHVFHSDLLYALTFCILQMEYKEKEDEATLYA